MPKKERSLRSAKHFPKVKDQLRKMEIKPSKQRGQNFVIEPGVIEAIRAFGEPKAHEHIVEIGPGLGALTDVLAGRDKLTLIELEPRFCDELKIKFPNAQVIQADARGVELSKLGSDLVVFGNLPYVFSTEIIFHLLKHRQALSRAVLLLQREFAERLAAKPGGRSYGSISVALQLWADIELGPIISGNSFHPPTAVESRVLELKFLAEPRVLVQDPVWFEKIVRAAFHSRRRMLHNSLFSAGFLESEAIDAALQRAQIDPKRRAETLSLEEFASLADALKSSAVKVESAS